MKRARRLVFTSASMLLAVAFFFRVPMIAQAIWQPVNGPWTPFERTVVSIAVEPNSGVVFAGLGTCESTWNREECGLPGGIYRSTDNGDHWVQAGILSLTVFSFVATPVGPVLAGTSGGVYRSEDKGETWWPSGLSTTAVRCFAIDPSGALLAGTESGLYRSMDNGESWASIPGIEGRINSLLVVDSSRILAATGSLISGGALYRSTDNGDTWMQTPLRNRWIFCLLRDSSGDVYAGTDSGMYSAVKTDSQWLLVGLAGAYVRSLTLNRAGWLIAGTEGRVYDTTSGIYYSKDHARSWTHAVRGVGCNALALSANSGDLLAGMSYYGVYRSTDGGVTWQQPGRTFPTTLGSLLISAHGTLLAGAGKQSRIPFFDGAPGLYRSTDNGASWDMKSIGGLVTSIAHDPHSGNIFLAATALYPSPLSVDNLVDTLYRSTDDGGTWAPTALSDSDPLNISFNCVAVGLSGEVLVGTKQGHVYQSTDGGDTWVTSGNLGGSVISITCNGVGILFASTRDSVYRSTDDGSRWQPIWSPAQTINFVTSDSAGNIFVGTDSGLYRSADNGASWVHAGLQTSKVTALVVNSLGHYFAVTVPGGVSHSTDSGTNWKQLDAGLMDNTVQSIAINREGYLFVGTSLHGIYRSTFSTPVSEQRIYPATFSLHQNYPNPLSARGASAYGGNPSTTIAFDLPQRTSVKLVVYDVLGREVKTLVDEEKAPGTYEVKFSAAELPSGIYFYKLTAGQFSAVRKMIVMR